MSAESTSAAEESRPLLSDNQEPATTYGTKYTSSPAPQNVDTRDSNAGPVGERKQDIRYILPALAIGIFLAALDISIINANYGKIATDFQSLELASWISTSYFLATSSCQPLYGKLSDIFGRKPCIIAAYSIFAVGSLFCGLAESMGQFIAARVIQGCGGSGIGILATVLISDVVSVRERGPWQGYINLINATGLAIGAPVGGLFADKLSWRWTFLIQVPITALAILSVVFGLKLPVKDKTNWRTSLRRVDFLGALLMVVAVVCLLLGLDRGSNVSWTAPITIVSLALVPPSLGLFLLVEAKNAAEPIAPGHIMLNRTVLSVYICNLFNYAGWVALIFYTPLFYQAVDGVTSSETGIRLLPAIIPGVLGILIGGFILKRTGRYYRFMVLSGLVICLGMIPVILGTVYRGIDALFISIGLVIVSTFYGFVVVGSLIALISSVAPENQAVATACMFLFRSVGSAIGISFSGTVLQHFLRASLRDNLSNNESTDHIIRHVLQSLDYIKQLDPHLQDLIRAAYNAAMRAAFSFQLGLFGASFLAVLWIREKYVER